MPSLHKLGKNYFVGFSIINDDPNRKSKYKVVWKSTKTDNKALAKQRMAQMDVEQQKGELALNNQKILLRDFVENHYLPWKKARQAYRTYMSNFYSCKHFMRMYGNRYLSTITPYMIEQYMTERKTKVIERTINIEVGCIKQMFRLAVEWEFLMKDPAKVVKKFKEPKGNPRFLSKDEISTLWAHSTEWLKMFIAFGLGAGLRYSEILSLRFASIDLKRNVIKITNDPDNGFMVKNRREREVPIAPFLYEAIIRFMRYYIDYSHDTICERADHQRQYFFCHADGSKVNDTKKAFARAAKRAGLKGVSPHTLRHTFASHLVMKGVDIKTVGDYLGHSSIKVTEIYVHLFNEHKQDSIKKLGFDNVFSGSLTNPVNDRRLVLA